MQQWINQAREHWREFCPKKVAELEKAGLLGKALYQAAEETLTAIEQMQKAGMTFSEAREVAMREYLLLEPEPEVLAALDAAD